MPAAKVNVALISSYVPRQCGIATYSNDLAIHLAQHVHRRQLAEDDHLSVVAMNDRDGEYKYGPQVHFEIRQHQRGDYRNVADSLNAGDAEVVNLQHEYGLYGGPDGRYIIELLDRLKKPAVTTLHTVLSRPLPGQRETLTQIAEHSSAVIVLADRAKMLCNEIYGIPSEKLHLIHHGTPDIAFHDPNDHKKRFQLEGRPVILTFGLLGPSKGIENMLDALATVAEKHPEVAYMIVGATHPVIRRESGESYRLGLERRIEDLGIADNVIFHNNYVSLPVLIEFMKAADLYVTPYQSKEQIVSGTLAFAVACGKAIVSTPYYYAQEMLADGRGLLAEFGDSKSLAGHIMQLLDDPKQRSSMQKRAYDFGRQMVWSAVAKQYDKVYRGAIKEFRRKAATEVVAKRPGLPLSLPEVRLDHLYRLTDDTGILQHATYSTPNRDHGYCTDDNARALLVAAMSFRLLNDGKVVPYMERYLSFLHHAWNNDAKRFRNFMSYDRRWLDDDGTEDVIARCIWALGYLVTHPPAEQDLSMALNLFHQAADSTRRVKHPRSQALCIVGFHYYLRRFGEATHIRELMESMAGELHAKYKESQGPDWRWLDNRLTYNNARIPQSLILAGGMLDNDEMLNCGLESLLWLLKSQTSPEGNLSVVGNDGWWVRGRKKAQFDQQPIEAVALVEACKAAYKANGDHEWLSHMRRCFEWYLGRNDLEASMVDFKTRGCADGLNSEGINLNQGAESTLCWLLALLTMYEMHPGRPVTDGKRSSMESPVQV